MYRLRAFAAALPLALLSLLVPSAPALAAPPPLTVSITCDAATGAVATSTSGTLFSPSSTTPWPSSVRVEFRRTADSHRVTATSATALLIASPTTRTVPVNGDGTISATGYRASFNPVGTLDYRETVQVTFRDATTGDVYLTRTASCDVDHRTTIHLTCDAATGDITAATDGVDGLAGSASGAGQAARVVYQSTETSVGPDGLGFTTTYPPVRHILGQTPEGEWSDTGITENVGHPYRHIVHLVVGVFDPFNAQVGGGVADCTLSNPA